MPMKNTLVDIIGVLMLIAIIVAFSRSSRRPSQQENIETNPRSNLVTRLASFLMYLGLVCIFLPAIAIVVSTSGAVGAPFHLSSQVLGEGGFSLMALGVALIIFRMPIAQKFVRRE
jgi:ABC-type Fe3+ transport system permease subunit